MSFKDLQKYMYRATMVSLFCNVVLVLIKSVALIMVNSLAIAVDLGISVVGLSVSVILYYSVKMSNRPADLFHNYGYGKVEHVCEAIEAIVLVGIALAMSFQAVTHLLNPKNVHLPLFGAISSAVNASINFSGAYYIFKMGEKSRSPAIKAEALHYRLEGLISSIICIAFVIVLFLDGSKYHQLARFLDPAAALLVSLLIIIPSIKLAKSSFYKLLDSSVEETSQFEIYKQLGRFIDKYCEFKDLRTRTSGRKRFIELCLVVPDDITVEEGYKGVKSLNEGIRESIPDSEVLVAMEPCKKDCQYAKNGETCPYKEESFRNEK